MESDEIWRIWETLSYYIPNKDKADAAEEFINQIYDNDACPINELLSCSEEYDDEIFTKCAKRFIKENMIDEDEEEDY